MTGPSTSKTALGLSEISSELSSEISSEITTANSQQRMSEWFLRFSEQTSGSPMYQYLSNKISQDTDLLSVANHCDPRQPAPNLFLAAIHFLLINNTANELSRYYPSLGGRFEATPRMFDDFKGFVKKHESAILEVLKTKLVQTNEVQRCAILLPAISLISEQIEQSKIALIDLGASGGLNFLLDKVHILYSNGTSLGPENSSLILQCESRGSQIPRFQSLTISSKIGIDLNPIYLLNENESQWNLALIWPDQLERFERFRTALTLLKDIEVDFKKGSGTQILPDVIGAVPKDQAVCVMHSFTLNQFSRDDRVLFDSMLETISLDRPIWRLSLEWIGTTTPELRIIHYKSGRKMKDQKIAECHGHGEWLDWKLT